MSNQRPPAPYSTRWRQALKAELANPDSETGESSAPGITIDFEDPEFTGEIIPEFGRTYYIFNNEEEKDVMFDCTKSPENEVFFFKVVIVRPGTPGKIKMKHSADTEVSLDDGGFPDTSPEPFNEITVGIDYVSLSGRLSLGSLDYMTLDVE